MTDLFKAADHADRQAARQLLTSLSSDTPLTRRQLNEAMVSAFGGSDAEGRWTQRESFEVLEHALALHIRASGSSLSSFCEVLPMIELAGRLPTQTVRSEDQIEWQQFSTPVDIAAVAVLLANVQSDDGAQRRQWPPCSAPYCAPIAAPERTRPGTPWPTR